MFHRPIGSSMRLKHDSIFRLGHPFPLHDPDGFIQSLWRPQILQDLLAILGTSISHESQNGSVAFESFSFGGLARYAYSGRILARSFF